MFDYVYFYPKDYGAPSYVAKNIFDALMENELPFNLIVFPANKKIAANLKIKYPDIKIISLKELLYNKTNLIIHFPVSPVFFPNKKFLVFLLSIFKRNKLIINYHGEPRGEYRIRLKNYDFKEAVLSLPTYLLMQYFIRSADIIVLNSYFMKKIFESSYNTTQIAVIPNALPSTWFDIDNLKKIVHGDDEISLFYHGRLSPEKGVDILLKGFHNFLKQHSSLDPTLKLYIAGDGEQRKNLENLAKDLNISSHVVFLGKIPLIELKSYLISVNAAIYPSVYEPFSLAVLESFALLNGPVLYSKIIGINNFVQEMDFNFYTFEPTIDGITGAINILYEKRYDDNIHSYQKAFSHELTWQKVVMHYIELYKKYV